MIVTDKIPEPTPRQLIALDDELADRGVPVFQRPLEAAKLWGEKFNGPLAGLEMEGEFRQWYREIHSSVPFDDQSFLTLCVSARSVSYAIKPPMAFGRVGIRPLDHTIISKFEVTRLYHDHEEAFWELHWQGFDAIDIFMSWVNFSTKIAPAQNMMQTAINQLTASARQLIACEIDASLPQGIAMASELAGKAVFLWSGGNESELTEIGHDLPKLANSVATFRSSPVDDLVQNVAASLPKYVAVRYNAPPMTISDAQDMYRRAMFFVADMIRRTNHDQGYWNVLKGEKMPSRILV